MYFLLSISSSIIIFLLIILTVYRLIYKFVNYVAKKYFVKITRYKLVEVLNNNNGLRKKKSLFNPEDLYNK